MQSWGFLKRILVCLIGTCTYDFLLPNNLKFHHLSILLSTPSYSGICIDNAKLHGVRLVSPQFWHFEDQRLAIFPRCRNGYCISMFLTSEPKLIIHINILFVCKFLIKLFSLWWSCRSLWCLECRIRLVPFYIQLYLYVFGSESMTAIYLSFLEKIILLTLKGTNSTWNVR